MMEKLFLAITVPFLIFALMCIANFDRIENMWNQLAPNPEASNAFTGFEIVQDSHGTVEERYLPCYYSECIVSDTNNWRNYSDQFDAKYNTTFLSSNVTNFMSSFIEKCYPNRTLHGGLLNSRGNQMGFGSVMNTALGAYHIAVATNRQYQIMIHDWNYGSLTTFFEDFAASTACPLFRNISEQEYETMLRNDNAYTLSYVNETVIMNSTFDTVTRSTSGNFMDVWNVWNNIYQRDPNGAFETKSLLARAVWQLRSELYNLLKVLLYPVFPNGFIAVHVRRGDKIREKEMEDISMQRYADKVRNVSDSSAYNKTVYIMTDEHSSYFALRALLESDFPVYNIEDLVRLANSDPQEILSHAMDEVKCNNTLADDTYWRKHAVQIVLETTMLALADDVVCTMSSNLCRLIALLRGDKNRKIHSLDSEWYHL